LADSAGGKQVFNHIVEEKQHELLSVEPIGEKQDALLWARGAKQAAFAGIIEDGLIAASLTAETRKTSITFL